MRWLACIVLAAACQAPVDPTAAAMPKPASATTPVASASPTTDSEASSAAATTPGAHHCEGSPVECGRNAAPPMPQPAAGGQRYGAEFDEAVPLTALADVMARPGDYATKVVTTRGTIGRVCQNRGCWMELRAETDQRVARVPMAGHAFFVPMDSSGRAATVQGVVSVRAGTENPVRIDATSVLIADARVEGSAMRSN